MVSYRSVFAVSSGPPKSRNYGKKYFTLRLCRRLYYFLTATDLEREEIKISHVAKFVCPMSQFLKHPAKSAFKHLILMTPICQHLLLTISSIPTSVKLNDSECEKGQVTQ
jgi:hypothetical protein